MFNLDTDKNRWFALIVLALGLAIVIIDNTVLNVAIPYILRDLKTSVDSIQWVVSGYALIIATLLITMGRLGDLFGRKRIFLIGAVLFAIGSGIASFAGNITILFFGEALIEAIGAAMMLTSSLSLLASEFHGKERAIAFGVWGSVAGASATIGPLLGGYLTTYYSWRWSLRINLLVALVVIIGSVFIKESKGEHGKRFDWAGTFLSGLGLFSLVFALIEGRRFGWWNVDNPLSVFGLNWPTSGVSVIPFAFLAAIVFLTMFVWFEYKIEKNGGSPLLKLSMFKNLSFSFGAATLGIVSLGQFGVFFILPIYLQNVLGLDAFKTGVVFLSSSISVLIFGPLSGFIASKIGPKWVVSTGMVIMSIGMYLLTRSITLDATGWTLAPALVVMGIGIGMPSAQLTNLLLSSVPIKLAGEASAVNSTMRQVGTSIGIAIIGAVLIGSLNTTLAKNINSDSLIPSAAKARIISSIDASTLESGQSFVGTNYPPVLVSAIKDDVKLSLVESSRDALKTAYIFILFGTAATFLLPNRKVTVKGRVREASD